MLTGASGAGKTTLAKCIQDRYWSSCHAFFFDSVGFSSPQEMQQQYGSGEQWQRAMTLGWLQRVKPLLSAARPALLEGQMRIGFIHEALASAGVSNARIVLVDCNDATRTKRLSLDRNQPELANDEMMKWAGYLREEAANCAGAEILNTGVTSLEGCIAFLRERLGQCSDRDMPNAPASPY